MHHYADCDWPVLLKIPLALLQFHAKLMYKASNSK